MGLFNNFTELKSGKLRDKIIEITNKENFPISRVYVMDESKRTTELNAYYSGFGPFKYICIYDNLLNLSEEQIISIFCYLQN